MLNKTCTVMNVNILCMLFISSVIHLITNGNSFRGYSALCQTPEVHIQDQNFLKEVSNLELLAHVMYVILTRLGWTEGQFKRGQTGCPASKR